MLPFDKMPYTNFHELNLAYFIVHFREIFAEWETLYNNMVSWREQTNQSLELWKTDTLNAIEDYERDLTDAWDAWKAETALDITDWKNETLDALDAWKTAFQTLFDSTFSNLSQIKTDAEAARDAAIAAQNRAEAAAETLVLDPTLTSPTQAAQAKAVGDAVDDLQMHLHHVDDIIKGDSYNPYAWEAGTYMSINVGSTLTETNAPQYINIRKRFADVTTVLYGSTITMKPGYKINLLTVDNQNQITAATNYVDSVTLEPEKRYGAVIKATNDADISTTAISAMLDVSVAESQIEQNRINIGAQSDITQKITYDLSEWEPIKILSGYAINVDNGNLISGANYRYTDYVSAGTNTRFKVTCRAYSSVCGGYSYDENKNPLRAYMIAGSTGIDYIDEIISPLPDEKYFRFSTVNVNTTRLSVRKFDIVQNPLRGKALLNFGDSIAAGDGNSGIAYAKYIAWANDMTLYDYALGGATLTNFTPNNNVQNQIDTAIAEHPDDSIEYILFEGGTNDLTNNTPTIGELVSGYDIITNPRDISTIIGAGENIIGKLRNAWPDAKIIYVSVHKMPTRNLTNQQDIHDAMEATCAKWSIQIADIFTSGGINSCITSMLPGNFPAHPDDPTYPTGYDRTHPAEDGYRRFYVPFIAGLMRNE